MKKVIFLLVLIMIFLPYFAKSQTANYNIPPKSFYKNATITLKDFEKYKCKNLAIQSDSVSFTNLNKRLSESIALANIDYIRVKEGNQAITGCIYGAIFMGITAWYSSINYGYYNNQNSGQAVAVLTISGGVIGGLIGLAIPKWKTYYLDN